MGKELRYPFGFIKEKEQINEANRLIREIGFTLNLINADQALEIFLVVKDKALLLQGLFIIMQN